MKWPKPTSPRIRWDHPLARAANLWAFWPFANAGGWQVSEQIQGAHAMLSGNTGSSWGSGPHGPQVELREAGTGEELTIGNPYPMTDIWPATVTAAVRIFAGHSSGSTVLEMGPFATSGWWRWKILATNGLNGDMSFTKDWGGGNPAALTDNVAAPVGTWMMISVSYNNGSNASGTDIIQYLDGAELAPDSTVSGTTWRSDAALTMTVGDEGDTDFDIAGLWVHKGLLTPNQIAELHADPWAMARRSTKTTLWVAATSGGAAPTGNRRRRFLIGAA